MNTGFCNCWFCNFQRQKTSFFLADAELRHPCGMREAHSLRTNRYFSDFRNKKHMPLCTFLLVRHTSQWTAALLSMDSRAAVHEQQADNSRTRIVFESPPREELRFSVSDQDHFLLPQNKTHGELFWQMLLDGQLAAFHLLYNGQQRTVHFDDFSHHPDAFRKHATGFARK